MRRGLDVRVSEDSGDKREGPLDRPVLPLPPRSERTGGLDCTAR